jgi:altronate dehydratase small subunit
MHEKDNVATALTLLEAGEEVVIGRGDPRTRITLSEPVPFGHKVAVRLIDEGALVIKYGQIIGRSTARIEAGQHVHVHNIESLRGRGDLQ